MAEKYSDWQKDVLFTLVSINKVLAGTKGSSGSPSSSGLSGGKPRVMDPRTGQMIDLDTSKIKAAEQSVSRLGNAFNLAKGGAKNLKEAVGALDSGLRGLTGVSVLGIGSLVGLGKVIRDVTSITVSYKKELYEVSRSFSVGTSNMASYSKFLKEMSSSTGRGIIETTKLVSTLKSSYVTANLSNASMKKIVETLSKEFPFNLEEVTKKYIELQKALPTVNNLLEKEALTLADLADVSRATGGDKDFFLRLYARQHGVLTQASEDITELTERMLRFNKVKEDWQLGLGGALFDFGMSAMELASHPLKTREETLEGTSALGEERGGLIKRKAAKQEALSRLMPGPLGGIFRGGLEKEIKELDYQIKAIDIVIQSTRNATMAETDRLNKLKAESDEYERQKDAANKHIDIINIINQRYDAQLGILEATYRPIMEQGSFLLLQVNMLENIVSERQKIVDTLREEGKALEDNKEYQEAQTNLAQAELAVAQKRQYIQRSFMEKMLQLQLGLSKGTYTMPTTMGEGLTKGPGYSPFAPLERGGTGGKAWGSYNAKGEFEKRPRTGPYEKFYQRLFGGAAGFRSPHEKVVENRLSGIEDNTQKMVNTLNVPTTAGTTPVAGGSPAITGTVGSTVTPVASTTPRWNESPSWGRVRAEEEKPIPIAKESIKELIDGFINGLKDIGISIVTHP